jgi:RNA polymerase subunit RPABC4/transcription elongation factor Spt4
MGLVACKACSVPVDSSANACPRCGATNPGMTFGGVLVGIGGLALFMLIFGWLHDACH